MFAGLVELVVVKGHFTDTEGNPSFAGHAAPWVWTTRWDLPAPTTGGVLLALLSVSTLLVGLMREHSSPEQTRALRVVSVLLAALALLGLALWWPHVPVDMPVRARWAPLSLLIHLGMAVCGVGAVLAALSGVPRRATRSVGPTT